jgi:hypothetical protein
MAKGKTYRLVDTEGCRVLHVPLSLWPALTGIVSDNEFQFTTDCWESLVKEVLNMPCGCLPEGYALLANGVWFAAGEVSWTSPAVPADTKRRITQVMVRHESAGVVDSAVYAKKGAAEVSILSGENLVSDVPYEDMVDVFLVTGDAIKLVLDVEAASGNWWLGLWGEEWTD